MLVWNYFFHHFEYIISLSPGLQNFCWEMERFPGIKRSMPSLRPVLAQVDPLHPPSGWGLTVTLPSPQNTSIPWLWISLPQPVPSHLFFLCGDAAGPHSKVSSLEPSALSYPGLDPCRGHPGGCLPEARRGGRGTYWANSIWPLWPPGTEWSWLWKED